MLGGAGNGIAAGTPVVLGFSSQSLPLRPGARPLCFSDFVRERYAADDRRIILTGFLQGGTVAYAVGARHPDVFCGVIPMGAACIPEIDAPPDAPDDRAPPLSCCTARHGDNTLP